MRGELPEEHLERVATVPLRSPLLYFHYVHEAKASKTRSLSCSARWHSRSAMRLLIQVRT